MSGHWKDYALTEVRTVNSRAKTAVATLQRLRDDETEWGYYGKPNSEIDDMIFQLQQATTHLDKWARKRRGKRGPSASLVIYDEVHDDAASERK